MTKFGDDLITALGQALGHSRGDSSGVGAKHEIDLARDAVDVRAVRRRVGLKQAEMARIMDMSLSGYRKWEQNTRSISGPARTMLVIMEREPEAVLRALGQDLARPSRTGAGKKTALSEDRKRRSSGRLGESRSSRRAA